MHQKPAEVCCSHSGSDFGDNGHGIVEHPLEDWDNYKDYPFPNPEQTTGLFPIDWTAFEEECAASRARGEMVYGDLHHGHMFQQLAELHGFENLIFDFYDEEPLLLDFIAPLEQFNYKQITHFVKAEVDMIRIPENLDMQKEPMI